MMAAVSSLLQEMGVPDAQIYTESFGGQGEVELDDDLADANITFRRSRLTCVAPAGMTLLDAADNAGVSIESSCRVGTCGSCKVQLLDGKVKMHRECVEHERATCKGRACMPGTGHVRAGDPGRITNHPPQHEEETDDTNARWNQNGFRRRGLGDGAFRRAGRRLDWPVSGNVQRVHDPQVDALDEQRLTANDAPAWTKGNFDFRLEQYVENSFHGPDDSQVREHKFEAQANYADLANTMLDAAIETVTASGDRPVVHSDRGGHYRWPGWLSRIADAKLVRSMSRKGYSPDNAACEGFFGRLKTSKQSIMGDRYTLPAGI